ncbi:MAG: hypothetical protein ACJA2M_000313 [Polaribacter sp.]|jgi:hypothetical protein
MKLIWIDDIRDPSEEIWVKLIDEKIGDHKLFDIIWVKNYQEFVACMVKQPSIRPDFISFDHDLADEHYTPEKYWDDYAASKAYQDSRNYTEKTGLDCAKWLIELCLDNNLNLPNFYVHSHNPVGADNINGLLNNFNKFKHK